MDQIDTARNRNTGGVAQIPFQCRIDLSLIDTAVITIRYVTGLISGVLTDKAAVQRVDRYDTFRRQVRDLDAIVELTGLAMGQTQRELTRLTA